MLSGFLLCLWLFNASPALPAQTNTNLPPHPPGAHENSVLSFLTPAQQEQYAQARAKALENDPKLKSSGEQIAKQGGAIMANGTAAEKQMFLEKMTSHRQKLRQAMLKVDPTLEPIFVQIDKHISEMKAKRLGATQPPPASTTAAPANPSAER